DHEHIYPAAVIPLQNEEGTRFYGRVLEVGTDTVKVDLNHPLAGQKLQFKGKVIENREATNEEIQQLIKQLTGGCGGCGGNCHGGCGSDGDCECGCGCK
ncbi:MAG: peptidylprolyl isomerase, partial [Prevotella sp.]|nr:peptidylprolyl isomerase [Prevotella sp.]